MSLNYSKQSEMLQYKTPKTQIQPEFQANLRIYKNCKKDHFWDGFRDALRSKIHI